MGNEDCQKNKDGVHKGRVQRTQLAPLSKTCEVMAAKQCLRPPPPNLPAETSPAGTEHNLELKGGSSIEFLREKGELEFETFL